MPSSLCLCPPSTLILVLDTLSQPVHGDCSSVPTGCLAGTGPPSAGREIEPKDLLRVECLVFLSVLAEQSLWSSSWRGRGTSRTGKPEDVCLLSCSLLTDWNECKDKQTFCSAQLGQQARLMPREQSCWGSNQSRSSFLSHTARSSEAQQRRGPVTIFWSLQELQGRSQKNWKRKNNYLSRIVCMLASCWEQENGRLQPWESSDQRIYVNNSR